MLLARATLKAQYEKLAIVREDAVCRRLMTVPGVCPVVAVTFKSAVDDPSRIAKSKAVGALFGLTTEKYQSGEKDVTGGITRTGDEMVRTALYEAANVLLSRITGWLPCSLARSVLYSVCMPPPSSSLATILTPSPFISRVKGQRGPLLQPVLLSFSRPSSA